MARIISLFFILVLLTGCSTTHKLAPPPNIYNASSPYPAASVSNYNSSTNAEILYVTDRKTAQNKSQELGYGKERSESMVLGAATVRYSDDLNWEALVGRSQIENEASKTTVEVKQLTEIARFPPTPILFSNGPEGIIIDKKEKEDYARSTSAMKAKVRDRLAKNGSDSVILFVHGFNTSFDEAVLVLNDIWHYSGRKSVPIAYSWPSGSGNLFGYFTDRESGEFTVYHLKETIRILSQINDVKSIHVIAHSRGTDITTTALRELVIESRASGLDPRETLKIDNLILAAPDLDYGVVTQRLIAEKFGPAFGQVTIYMNEGDSALGISQFLMRGLRFGKLTTDKQNSRENQIFRNVKNVSFVSVTDVSGFVGHGYFTEHSGALSDLIKVINTNSAPGSAERPLTHIDNNFWSLNKSYQSSSPAPLVD